MDKLRAKRDSIEKGDTVLIEYPGGLEGKRSRRAKVVEVMRMACRVVFDDDHKERAVMMKHITRVEEEEDMPRHPPPIKPPAIAPVIVMPKKPEPKQEPDDVGAWLAMGAQLIGQLETRIAAAELSAAGLQADSAALLEEAERQLHEAASLKDKLTKLRNVAGRK